MRGMWNAVFDLDPTVYEKIIRAVVIYVFLVLALRIVGKRELAQLNTLDFVVLLAVANAVQNGLIGADNSVTGAVIGATVLFVVNSVLAYVVFRSNRLRHLVEGSPTELIRDGQILEDALRQQQLTHDDLLEEIQSAGADTFDDVQTARLLPNGKVIVIPRTTNQASVQYDDLRARLDHLTGLVEELSRR